MRLPDTHTSSFSTGRTRVNRSTEHFGARKRYCLYFFWLWTGVEIIILQQWDKRTFSANPPPGEQMRDVRQSKWCKAVSFWWGGFCSAHFGLLVPGPEQLQRYIEPFVEASFHWAREHFRNSSVASRKGTEWADWPSDVSAFRQKKECIIFKCLKSALCSVRLQFHPAGEEEWWPPALWEEKERKKALWRSLYCTWLLSPCAWGLQCPVSSSPMVMAAAELLHLSCNLSLLCPSAAPSCCRLVLHPSMSLCMHFRLLLHPSLFSQSDTGPFL